MQIIKGKGLSLILGLVTTGWCFTTSSCEAVGRDTWTVDVPHNQAVRNVTYSASPNGTRSVKVEMRGACLDSDAGHNDARPFSEKPCGMRADIDLRLRLNSGEGGCSSAGRTCAYEVTFHAPQACPIPIPVEQMFRPLSVFQCIDGNVAQTLKEYLEALPSGQYASNVDVILPGVPGLSEEQRICFLPTYWITYTTINFARTGTGIAPTTHTIKDQTDPKVTFQGFFLSGSNDEDITYTFNLS